MITSCLMGTIFYFFSFTTDVLRMWPNYDVNCQKVFGGFIALITACLGMRTFWLFRARCFRSFLKGWFCFDVDGVLIDGCNDGNFNTFDGVETITYFEFDSGIGYVLLGVSTFLKVINLVCHLIIPTPSITRNKELQWEYELKATELLLQEQQEAEHDVAGKMVQVVME